MGNIKTKDTTCVNCGKKFKYENYGDVYPGGKTKEDVDCPYCNTTNFEIMTSGFIRTSKIEEE